MLDNEINRELIRFFLEASGLVVKLYNKLQTAHVPDSENHIAAAKDFIHRNQLYKQALEFQIKKDNPNG